MPELPFLPVLPARGAGADPVGRTAALLVDLHVDLQPAGWRLVTRPGRDEARARSYLTTDLDAVEEAAQGYAGAFKVQVLGPWSLVATLELQRGEKALADPGAVRDISTSLAAGVTAHVADLLTRVPGIDRVVLQIDEPMLGAVVEGAVSTASGWGRIAGVEQSVAADVLAGVIAACSGGAGVRTPWAASMTALLQSAGARFLGFDAAHAGPLDSDETGAALEDGMGLMVALPSSAGAEDAARSGTRGLAAAAEPIRELWRRAALAPADAPAATLLTTGEDLEHVDLAAAARMLRWCRDVARYLADAAAQEAP